MIADILILAASFGFVFAFIGLATFLHGKNILDARTTRKVIHIGVAHWWLLYILAIDSPVVGIIGSLSFILINFLSWKLHLFKAMEDPLPSRNLGAVYFPVSLFVLVLFSLPGGIMERWEAGVGVLIMGWGDGMAALVGYRYGTNPGRIFGQRKSVAGTAALVFFASAVAVLMSLAFDPGLGAWQLLLRAGATGLFAALVELCTPFGLDNITVPILGALFFHFVAAGDAAGPFAAAAALNAIVAWGAWAKKAVTASGAVMGAAVGTAILAAGGLPAYAILAGFFLSSTALGRASAARRAPSGIEQKGGRRDEIQVLANCGSGTLAALLYAATGHPAWLAAFAAGFASANADTWASEIGVLYRKLPRSILTFKPIPAGSSGGVSPLGFLASALGAGFIGILFALAFGSLGHPPSSLWLIAIIAAIGGFAGAALDSLLGATIQAQYSCVETGKYTERPTSSGRPNILVRGLRWVDNDIVNLASTVAASLGAALIYSGALIASGLH